MPLPSCLPSYRDLGTPIASVSDIYVVQNSIASSTIYLSHRYLCSIWILIYPFNIFMHGSFGYIHRKNIGIHILISLTRWVIKCTMISKNEREKYISSWHKIMIASFSNSSNLVELITFLQIVSKNRQRWLMTYLTIFGKIPQIVTRRRSCVKTKQSWDFKPISFKYSIFTRLWYLKSVLMVL